MKEFFAIVDYYKKNKKQGIVIMISTIVGLVIGGYAGMVAFYNGWLG
ncbi:MAG: hypothetical protein IKJ01_08000 [Lachnospiraceae bacterium]|nr:hypothetical protein [Lachnospiraceae bacterium]